MSEMEDAALRALLADPALARPDPRFTATVLSRWGAQRRRRRYLARLLIGVGTLGSLAALAPQAVRSMQSLMADQAPVVLAVAGALVLLSVLFSRRRA